MAETPTLMEAAGNLSSLLGIGQSIQGIFAGTAGGLDDASIASIAILQSMLDNLLSEVKQVFLDDLTDEAVNTASGVAQAAHDFLAVVYRNAQLNGVSSAQLWTLLTQDSGTPRLSDLQAQATTMMRWATTDQTLAQKTLSLALTLLILIVAFRRERAANAPDPATRAAETANMQQFAKLAVTRLQPLVSSFAQRRLQALNGPFPHTRTIGGPKATFFYWGYEVQDAWPPAPAQPNGAVLTVMQHATNWDSHGKDPHLLEQIDAAHSLYRNLLSGGSNDQANAWVAALNQMVSTGYFVGQADWDAIGLALCQPALAKALPTVQSTGHWLYHAGVALQNLQKMSLPPSSAPQPGPPAGPPPTR